MKKISTVAKIGNEILKEPKLTISLDLGDRTSLYCILDETGKVILEHSLATTSKASGKSSTGSRGVESH
jgi:transposase